MSTFHDRIQFLAETLDERADATSPLEDVVAVFRHWLHLPDPGPVYTVLATVAANRMAGDPVWALIVGPPGGGKTEIIASITNLAEVKFAATLTEAALLSGTPKKEKAGDATGGLLRQVGEYGIVVCKDFTSILAMNRDSRGQVLAALREVYDGSWTRLVGTDGGRVLHWAGKVGLVAGCTPTIDRHHAVMGAMGERFVLYRLPVTNGDADELAHRSLMHVGQEAAMRSDLRTAVADLFATVLLPDAPPRVGAEDSGRLVRLATFAVRCRSTVERDTYSREIELIPEAEAPTRLVNVLARMLASYRLVGVPEAEAWLLTVKLALDSMPAIRRLVLEELRTAAEPVATDALADVIDYPTTTTRRALEDLAAHGICKRHGTGKGKAHEWALTDWTRERFPEIPFRKFLGSDKSSSGLSGNHSEGASS